MPLKVIGAGFGRTGTMTLKTALEQLGFGPCHHMVEVLENIDRQSPLWSRVVAKKPVEWDEIFAGYNSTVDWPGCHFWAELADRYPDAKVILTVRDPVKWYASMKETILATPVSRLILLVLRIARHPMLFAQRIISRDTFRYDYSEANAIAVFERHNAEVRRRIPSERLLEFDVRQGWEPLCAFLDVPVPDTPFPRTNDREEFQRHAEKVRQMGRRKKAA